LGSIHNTLPSPDLRSLLEVVFISLIAPLTLARSAMASGSIIASSELNALTTASADSLSFLTGAKSASGSSVSRRSSSPLTANSRRNSDNASPKLSPALLKFSANLPGICRRSMVAALLTLPAVNSSVTACVVRSINS